MTQPPKLKAFMEFVQYHERSWGDEDYPNRPDLIDILRSPVCVFWQDITTQTSRYTVSLHQDMRDIEEYMAQLIFRRNNIAPDKRLVRIFTNAKPTRIKGIKIIFETQDPDADDDMTTDTDAPEQVHPLPTHLMSEENKPNTTQLSDALNEAADADASEF
ncbi:MAG: hypothetical protein KC546_09755 [Anaerolineae bacterium]|nr:hypothetical protein [Anaerolineae bacterium]MCA9888649.1 hypothetical protein [Anaerolineae bacterium]MCA9891820.1 hypothetical protein [Anaerolineae bacterium]